MPSGLSRRPRQRASGSAARGVRRRRGRGGRAGPVRRGGRPGVVRGGRCRAGSVRRRRDPRRGRSAGRWPRQSVMASAWAALIGPASNAAAVCGWIGSSGSPVRVVRGPRSTERCTLARASAREQRVTDETRSAPRSRRARRRRADAEASAITRPSKASNRARAEPTAPNSATSSPPSQAARSPSNSASSSASNPASTGASANAVIPRFSQPRTTILRANDRCGRIEMLSTTSLPLAYAAT